MRIPSPSAKRRARIEIIPLIDVVFFLLATFVMVSTSMIKNRGIPIRLPIAATGLPQDRRVFATISVAEDGSIYLDKQPIALQELGARLLSLKAEDERLRIFIHGDERAAFGQAIQVFDAVRSAGIADVSIQTRLPERGTAQPL
jgi:biopolymer transport protein ExbD